MFEGFSSRPSLDELDALGAALGTSGGVSMFIVPGVTPPYASVEQCFPGGLPDDAIVADQAGIRATYEHFTDPGAAFDLVHVGCPHASFEEIKDYARLLDGKRVDDGVELWVTTSRSVRNMAAEAGLVSGPRARRRQGDLRYLPDVLPFRAHRLARSGTRRPAAGSSRHRRRFGQAGQIRARHDPLPDAADQHRARDRDGDQRPLRAAFSMSARVIRARGLVAGLAEGPALVSPDPISFLGDVAITTGEIVAEESRVKGRRLGGTVLVFPGSMGSAGAWRFLYQLYKHGTHPVALVACTLPDPSVVQGAILSGIPVVCQPSEDVLTTLADGEHLRVDGAAGTITVEADR